MLLVAEGVNHLGGDAFHEEDVRADGAVVTDEGIAAHNGRPCVDGDMVADGWMALLALQGLACGEGFCNEADALVELDAFTDLAGFANDDNRCRGR